MSSLGGLPIYVGKIGRTSIETMAERIAERVPVTRSAAVVIHRKGAVWIDEVWAADPEETVCTYSHGFDCEEIAGDIEFACKSLGVFQ